MMWALLTLLLVQGAATEATSSRGNGSSSSNNVNVTSGRLSVHVDSETRAYRVLLDGSPFFDSAGDASVSGGYAFSADGQVFSQAKNSLRTVGPLVTGQGVDPGVGPFTSISQGWSRPSTTTTTSTSSKGKGEEDVDVDGGGPEWITTFKAYTTGRSAIVFRQEWPVAASDSQGGSTFPALRQATPARLGVLEYCGSSCGFMVGAKGTFPGISGGKGRGYSIIAAQDTSPEGTGSNATLSIGPVLEHFVNQGRNGGDSLCYGAAPGFEFMPAGYALETVLVAAQAPTTPTGDNTKKNTAAIVSDSADGAAGGTSVVFASTSAAARVSVPASGVNSALFEYGDFQLARHNKTRTRGDHNTETRTLGYSTTGFYFYNLCDCLDEPPPGGVHARRNCSAHAASTPIPPRYLSRSASPGTCTSYEDTLLAVDASLRQQGIPYQHMLLDSWWYGEGVFGGVRYWEDIGNCTGSGGADTFPRSLHSFYTRTNKTLWVHNGKWTRDTPYRAQYPFAPDNGPPQGPALWDHLFSANHKGWGLSTIKQDHMGEQMGSGSENWKNVSILKSWVAGMGEAAARNDVDVLYCCAPPNVHMSGVRVPSAYAVRASPDYVWGPGGRILKLPVVQWAIGPDSAFHWNGLGLLPYKDTFFSNSSMTQQSVRASSDAKDWPAFGGYHERDAQTHALMALLSMASVTFSDAVGQSNTTLLHQLCRKDGVLLKPDRPATAIDRQFQAMMFGGWPGAGGGGGGVQPADVITRPCGDVGDAARGDSGGGNGDGDRSSLQNWHLDKDSGAISLADPGNAANGGCLDVAKCARTPGSHVHLYYGPSGYVCGKAGQPGTCSAKNEVWQLVPSNSSTDSWVQLRSSWNGLCLHAMPDAPASAVVCNAADPNQQFVAKNMGNSLVQFQTPQHDDAQCLTAVPPSYFAGGSGTAAATQGKSQCAPHPVASADGNDWHQFESQGELEAAADTLFREKNEERREKKEWRGEVVEPAISVNARRALAVSAEWMARTEARRNANVQGEQCPRGLGAPQGPQGEVYATHVTVSGFTWRYVVGVQLTHAFNVTVHDIGLGGGGGLGADAVQGYRSVAWSDADTFKPARAAELVTFSDTAPLQLANSTGKMCQTGSGVMNVTTECFPIQWHLVAPVLPNGWLLIGETGKLMPVSSARLTDVVVATKNGVGAGSSGGDGGSSLLQLNLVGAPGEVVEFGAAGPTATAEDGLGDPVYKTVTLGPDGRGTLSF